MSLRRIIDLFWSIIVAAALVRLEIDARIWSRITLIAKQQMLQRYITIPAFLGIYFACWAILCLPVNAARARFSILAWLNVMLEHGLMFTIGGSLLMVCQILSPAGWRTTFAIVLLILILATRYILCRDSRAISSGLRSSQRVLIVLLTWVWLVVGLILASRRLGPALVGSPLWFARLSVWMSIWVAMPALVLNFVFPKIAKDSALLVGRWSGAMIHQDLRFSTTSNFPVSGEMSRP